jgi:hypothetical protein
MITSTRRFYTFNSAGSGRHALAAITNPGREPMSRRIVMVVALCGGVLMSTSAQAISADDDWETPRSIAMVINFLGLSGLFS